MARGITTTLLLCFFAVCTCHGKHVWPCFVNGRWTDYDEKQQTCCNGTLEPVRNGKHCCSGAGKFYFEDEKVCCGNTLHDRRVDGIEYGCCDDILIRLDTQICCNAHVKKLPRDRPGDMICCGSNLVNQTTTICCQNEDNPVLSRQHAREKDFDCCGHLPLDLSHEKCRYNSSGFPLVISKNEEYCHGQVINLSEKTCCLDHIYNKPNLNPSNLRQTNPQVSCCGTNGYNPVTHTCCPVGGRSGSVIPKDDHLHCCVGSDTGYINSTYELCCGGQTHTRNSKHRVCCGRHQIDSRRQGCCNHQSYERRAHFCCEGVPSGVLEHGKTCCGGRELEQNNLCCDNTSQVARSQPTDDRCCLNYDMRIYIPYTDSKQACYNGMVETRATQDDDVCSGRRYQKSKAVCCDRKVHKFPEADRISCCQGLNLSETPFSEKHQICCQGNIFNMSVNEAECCNGVAYPKMAHDNPCLEKCGNRYHYKETTICCRKKVFSRDTDGDECCSNKPYFPQIQTCCQGKLHNSTGGQCCGTDLFDPKTHRCCGGYQVIQKKSKTQRCCHDVLAYNRRHGQCNSNGLVKRKRTRTPLENICKRNTWSDLTGTEVEVCARKFAIQCRVMRRRFSMKTNSFGFTMKCQNLKRPYLMEYHDSFVVQRKNSRLKISVISDKIKCGVRKNQKVIIFLDKQATLKKRRQYELVITEKDAFRVITDTGDVRKLISKCSSEEFCQRIFDHMNEDEMLEYFKQRW